MVYEKHATMAVDARIDRGVGEWQCCPNSRCGKLVHASVAGKGKKHMPCFHIRFNGCVNVKAQQGFHSRCGKIVRASVAGKG